MAKKEIQALSVDLYQAVEIDPWEKMPDEDPVWFDRFTKYRLLGPNRTIRETYRRERKIYVTMKEHAVKIGSSSLWNLTANEWSWKERAQAYDHMLQEKQEAEAEVVYNDGLSLIHNRIDKLKIMAAHLETYIMNPKNKTSPYIMEQYRGLLDDIARELGQRKKEMTISGNKDAPIVIDTQWGRGGSASIAWESQKAITETTVTEIANEN